MSGLVEQYNQFMETNSDPRTANWFMSAGPAPLFTLLATYVYFSVSAGPRYMQDKKPYELKNVLIVYNALQVVMSVFLVWEGLHGGWLYHYNLKCQPVDYSDNEVAMRMAGAVWWYYMCKLIELLDTVFFVLRKKNRQISFLHLYHHSLMPVCAWVGIRFLPGGHGTLLGLINSFIHVIMYGYYLMSALGPAYQKYLWWKKYLTTLQMVQFMIIFVHSAQPLISDCNYPRTIAFLLVLNAAIFLCMFGSFYINTYSRKTTTLTIQHVEQTCNGKESQYVHRNNNYSDTKTD